jgi:hypothetical protein
MIIIILEPTSTEYNVHQKLLDYASRYFRHALNIPRMGAKEHTVRIVGVDDDVCVFAPSPHSN